MEPGSSPDKSGALDGGDSRLDLLKDAKSFSINNNSISSNNNNNNNKSDSCSGGSSSNRVSPAPEKDGDSRSGVNSNDQQPSSNDKSSNNVHSNSNNDSSNSSSSSSNEGKESGESKVATVTEESRTTKSLAEELSAKNKEVGDRL